MKVAIVTVRFIHSRVAAGSRPGKPDISLGHSMDCRSLRLAKILNHLYVFRGTRRRMQEDKQWIKGNR